MYAKNLERILCYLCEGGDLSPPSIEDYSERFKSLRGANLLPQGRERRNEQLSSTQIASAVLGLVTRRPNWTALSAIILGDLRPVGGPNASFLEANNLREVIEILLSSQDARRCLHKLTTAVGETATNSHGGAVLVYEKDGQKRQSFFVSKMAASLLAPGREIGFDPDKHRLNSPTANEMTFSPAFFSQLARECEMARLFPGMPEGSGSEYDAEEAEQARYKELGVKPGSRYLNVAVDNQVTWPKTETLIKFDRYTLVLMPKTNTNIQSVHIDLTANKLSDQEAMTVINRFLSIMTWCCDNFAIKRHGWSGNPVPVPIAKPDLAFVTAHDYIFDRKIPDSEDAMRNAQTNGLISYAVLNYYRLIEIRHHGKETVRKWFGDNFEELRAADEIQYQADVRRFLELCGDVEPKIYIHDSCRIAVAHAGKRSKSDPDDSNEVAGFISRPALCIHLPASSSRMNLR